MITTAIVKWLCDFDPRTRRELALESRAFGKVMAGLWIVPIGPHGERSSEAPQIVMFETAATPAEALQGLEVWVTANPKAGKRF